MVAACKGYAAPTGLGHWVAWMATKISLLTELSDGARVCDPQRLRRFGGVWIIRRRESWRRAAAHRAALQPQRGCSLQPSFGAMVAVDKHLP